MRSSFHVNTSVATTSRSSSWFRAASVAAGELGLERPTHPTPVTTATDVEQLRERRKPVLLAEHVHQVLTGLLVVAGDDPHRGGDVALGHRRAVVVALLVVVAEGDQCREESVLGAEVAHDGRQRDACLSRDPPHRQRVEVLGEDDVTGGLEDVALGLCRIGAHAGSADVDTGTPYPMGGVAVGNGLDMDTSYPYYPDTPYPIHQRNRAMTQLHIDQTRTQAIDSTQPRSPASPHATGSVVADSPAACCSRRQPAAPAPAQRRRLRSAHVGGGPPHDLLLDPVPGAGFARAPPAAVGPDRAPTQRLLRGRLGGRADRHRAGDDHRDVRGPDDRSRGDEGARVRRHGRRQRACSVASTWAARSPSDGRCARPGCVHGGPARRSR